MKILGVMTGTSCDGLDAACIDLSEKSWKPLWARSAPYPKSLQEKVLKLQNTSSVHTLRHILDLDRDLGDWYGSVISKMLLHSSLSSKDRPLLIANHGQTVAHFPGTRGQKSGTTLQLGDPTRIAAVTGLSVVSHFRQGDLAAGGQGAPLVPYFHQRLVQKRLKKYPGIAVHNLGGISNFTYFGPKKLISAFDTGPGNLWIDAAVREISAGKRSFDRGGQLALTHSADQELVSQLLTHPFFQQSPPKATGRDDFPYSLLSDLSFKKSLSPGVLVATATAVTIRSIVEAYHRWILDRGHPLSEIYLTGGGVHNQAILQGIQRGMPHVAVRSIAELGADPQFIEAQAFAYLAYLSMHGQAVGGPWTGASSFGPPGQITPGQNWTKVLRAWAR